jgi:hypothetical protein
MPTTEKIIPVQPSPPAFRRMKWVYDPIPDFLMGKPDLWKQFVSIESKFAARQLELEQKAIDLEKERLAALAQFYK